MQIMNNNQIPPYSNLESNLAELETNFENMTLIQQLCATIWSTKVGHVKEVRIWEAG